MKKWFILIAAFSLSAAALYGQPARLAGLMENPTYGALLEEYDAVSAREEALETNLGEARARFAAGQQSETLRNTIIALETELYSVRSEQEELEARIKRIEQEWLREHPGAVASGGKNAASSRNIVYNEVFSRNLPQKEYATLLKLHAEEAEVASMLDRLRDNYDHIARLDSVYQTAAKEQADSIFMLLSEAARNNERLAGDIAEQWSDIFENKVYLYNWLLDKNGLTTDIADMERQMTNVRLRMGETTGEYMYDAAAHYPFQKSLLLRYESGFAVRDRNHAAYDSLKGAAMSVMSLDKFLLPKIEIEERLFPDYSDIEVVRPARYNSANPIPPTEVFRKGSMYRVLLGFYTNKQSVSLFRNIYPLSVEQKEDNKYYYYAGGFATFAEADAAAKKAKRFGIANPRIVLWHNGEYMGVVTDANHAQAPKSGSKEVRYRIEITGAGERLPDPVRSLLSENAPGKEITRVVEPETGDVKFTVGSFDDMKSAEKLAHDIYSVNSGLNINIFSVP